MSGGHGGGEKKSSNWIVIAVVAIFVVLALMVLTLNGLFGDESQASERGGGSSRPASTGVSVPAQPILFCQNVPDKEVTAPHPADTANPNADGNWSNGLYVPAGCTTYPDRTVLNVQCKETGGAWKGVAEDGCVGSFERYQSKTGEAITVSIPFRPNV